MQSHAIRTLTQNMIPSVIGVYARHEFDDEKRAVANAIAGEIKMIVDEI